MTLALDGYAMPNRSFSCTTAEGRKPKVSYEKHWSPQWERLLLAGSKHDVTAAAN